MLWRGPVPADPFGPDGRVRGRLGFQAEGPGGVDEFDEDLVGDAFGFGLSVYDLYGDALEDRPVEDLAEGGLFFGVVVGRAGLGEQQERVVEGAHDVIDLGDGLALPAFDLGLLFFDAGLFGLHDLDGDGVAVVELDELVLLGGQFVQAPGVAVGFGLGVGRLVFDELPDGIAERGLLVVRQPGPGVVHAHDGFFDRRDGGVRVAARPGGPDAAQARVVLVHGAELAAVVAVAQAAAADPAEDRAVEVVAVLL